MPRLVLRSEVAKHLTSFLRCLRLAHRFGGDAPEPTQMQEAVANISLDEVMNSTEVRNVLQMHGGLANFTRESSAREQLMTPWQQKVVFMVVSNHTCAQFACRGVKDCLYEAHHHIRS